MAAGVGSSDAARSAVGPVLRAALASAGTGALAGVAAVSPRLAWAVGETGSGHPLIERWNGVSWRVARGLAGADGGLSAVAAVSAQNAWAVGVTKAGFPLIARWNGMSWHRMRVAGPRGGLSGVSAVSPDSAWAVGSRGLGFCCSKPLVLRWDGSTWTRVPSPGLGGRHAELTGVSAVSATDAWTVGAINTGGNLEAVIEHWNGTRWRTALIDSTGFLFAVTARGSQYAWAVGYAGGGPLTLAWHGSAWRRVPARCPSEGCFLTGVAVVSRRLAWAVGTRLDPNNLSTLPVIMRWNGSTWKAVPSPQARGVIDGVVALSRRSAFAVGLAGSIDSIRKSRPRIERWNGTTWRLDQ